MIIGNSDGCAFVDYLSGGIEILVFTLESNLFNIMDVKMKQTQNNRSVDVIIFRVAAYVIISQKKIYCEQCFWQL